MILDGARVLALVRQWKLSRDNIVLGQFLDECDALVCAIISKHPPEHHDDMHQECMIALLDVLEMFDPARSVNIYGYVVRTVTNTCISYIHRCRQSLPLEDEDREEYFYTDSAPSPLTDIIMEGLIMRNRRRFPSLLCVIDDVSEYVYYRLVDGKKRGLVQDIMHHFQIPRDVATVVYHSTVIFLRVNLRKHVSPFAVCECGEYTLLPEVREVVGDKTFAMISNLFSGMYVKVP